MPADSRRIWLSLNSIFLFYQAIFKLMTEGFPYSVICDFYWPWILAQSCNLYQVHDHHCFLIVILCYFKPPGYDLHVYSLMSIHLLSLTLKLFVTYLFEFQTISWHDCTNVITFPDGKLLICSMLYINTVWYYWQKICSHR